MFRGAIEVVHDNAVSGWVYSDDVNVSGRTLLAFMGNTCVGSGQVGVFRQDLKDAGLGDGKLGFHFGITVAGHPDAALVVKFDASDAVLIAPDAVVLARSQPSDLLTLEEKHRKLAQLEWLSQRDILKAADFINMRDLLLDGYCTIDLKEDASSTRISSCEREIQSFMSLFYQMEIEIVDLDVSKGLSQAIDSMTSSGIFLPIVAIYSAEPVQFDIRRGSHRETDAEAEPVFLPLTQMRMRPSRVTLFDARVDRVGEPNTEDMRFFAAKLAR